MMELSPYVTFEDFKVFFESLPNKGNFKMKDVEGSYGLVKRHVFKFGKGVWVTSAKDKNGCRIYQKMVSSKSVSTLTHRPNVPPATPVAPVQPSVLTVEAEMSIKTRFAVVKILEKKERELEKRLQDIRLMKEFYRRFWPTKY